MEVKENDSATKDGAQTTKIKVAPVPNQEQAKAFVLLRHHIHDSI